MAHAKQGKPKKNSIKKKTPPEIIDFLIERINLDRLNSIYSHGHETLKYKMSDMKYLPALVIEDIKEEDNSLWNKFDEKDIQKTCARLLVSTLKQFLLNQEYK